MEELRLRIADLKGRQKQLGSDRLLQLVFSDQIFHDCIEYLKPDRVYVVIFAIVQ